MLLQALILGAVQIQTLNVAISGGHETDPRDRGRPVVLVAAGLGVPADVFREAFTHVRPAPAGSRPDPQQVQQNKSALLTALGRYGVTNERLDEVSNYYRYRRESGEIWTSTPAKALATIRKGVVSIRIVQAGSGYSSPPSVSIEGHPEIKLIAKVSYGKDLATNGSISSISVAK